MKFWLVKLLMRIQRKKTILKKRWSLWKEVLHLRRVLTLWGLIIKQQFFETVANMKKTYIENEYYYCSKSIEINDWSRCQFRKKNSLWEKVSLWKQNKRSKAFFIDSTDVKKTKLFNLRLLIDNKLSRNVNKKFQRKRIIADLHARARRAWAESRC